MISKEDKEFIDVFKGSLLIAVILVLVCLVLSSCSLFKKVERSGSDSANVKKQDESTTRVDTSKSKNESTYSKEYIYVPGRDTTINNYFPANSPQPIYIYRESGTNKQENQNGVFEDWKKHYQDSTAASQKQLSSKTDIKVGPNLFEIIIMIGLGLLLLPKILLLIQKFKLV